MGKKKQLLPVLARPGALWRFFSDNKAPWAPKLMVLVAVAYVLLPIDAFPDFAPVIGWLDDVGIVALTAGWLASSVSNYDNAETVEPKELSEDDILRAEGIDVDV